MDMENNIKKFNTHPQNSGHHKSYGQQQHGTNYKPSQKVYHFWNTVDFHQVQEIGMSVLNQVLKIIN